MKYQQRASKKIDKRGDDLTISLTSNKRVGHKNEAQDAMTKSPNKITDTSKLNLETKKLKNLRANHSPVTLKDLAKLSEQQTEVGSARGNSTSLIQDEQSDYRDTNVQNTKLWNQVEESLKKEKRDNQMSYKQILDEQMMHKDLLGRQGAMTRTEKGYNKGSPQKETAIDGVQKASMVVGFHNEYPIKNVAIAKALQRAAS